MQSFLLRLSVVHLVVWLGMAQAQEPYHGKLVNLEDADSVPTYRLEGEELEELELSSPLELGSESRRLRLPRLRHAGHHPYTDYRLDESWISYMPGSGDEFGWVDVETTPYQPSGYRGGFSSAIGFHFLGGPTAVDLPPRLYDFSLGYQHRGKLDDAFSYDISTSIGMFSDFESSARDGVRFPSHAVGMLHVSPETDWVFGIDYLHRDDIKILPVVGIARHSERHPAMRFDLVFPRPQIELALTSGKTIYLAGRLGGGTWDIEYPNTQEDVVTYRDYRLLLGVRGPRKDSSSSIEFGYVFGRKVDFRTASDVTRPEDAFILRLVTTR
ncbi:MAG: hypothetical protein ACK56W_15870 [Pirellula sp.]|jgi:hypothetical protein|nr:hypothetical protein [Pirellula sp.]